MKYSLLPASLKIIFASFLFISGDALAQPTINTFAPATGPVGTSVIISGTNFNATPASNIVFFGAIKASVISGSVASLTVTVPAGATYQPISVLNISTGLTAYSSQPFITTFANPFGTGMPANFYKSKVDFASGTNPLSASISDIDGDGKPDLVVANTNSNTVSVLRNTSTPGTITASSFSAKVDFASGNFTKYVAIADMDGDGKPDLVIVNSNNVSVLRNTAISGSITAASFAAIVNFDLVFTGPITVAIGDLDGDGKPDIVAANASANSISVLRNTSTPGSITASAKVDFGAGGTPSFVSIGDLDGDGKPDIAVTNASVGTNTVSVLRNTSAAGSITAASFAVKVPFGTGLIPRSVAIGDLDGDNKPELTVANAEPTSTTASVLLNTAASGSITTSSFAAKVDFTTSTSPFFVALGDLDGDGKPDIVLANQSSDKISVLRNTSTLGVINTAAKIDFTAGTQPKSVAIGDLDGDGIPEIVTANNTATSISIFTIDLSALPVTLTYVKAFQKNAGVQVEWTAEQEINILSYEVERSQNGQQFNKLQSVPAVGSSSTVTHYNIFDPNPFSGLNFYRVKIIEANKTAYSQVLKINNIREAKNSMNIYPNPVMGNSITVYWTQSKGKYMLTLTNSFGQKMLSKNINHAGGTATESFIITKHFPPGYYLIELSGEGVSYKNNLIKN